MGGVNSYCIGRCIKLPETDLEVANSQLSNTTITCGQIITDKRIIHQLQNGHHHFVESSLGSASRINQFDRSRSRSLSSQGTVGSNNPRRPKRASRLRHFYNRIRRPQSFQTADSAVHNGGSQINHLETDLPLIQSNLNGAASDLREHSTSSPPAPGTVHSMYEAGKTSCADGPNNQEICVQQVFRPTLAPHVEADSPVSASPDELRDRDRFASGEGALTPSPSLSSFVTCVSESARFHRPLSLVSGRSHSPPYQHPDSLPTPTLLPPVRPTENAATRKIRVLETLAAQCSSAELELLAMFRQQLHVGFGMEMPSEPDNAHLRYFLQAAACGSPSSSPASGGGASGALRVGTWNVRALTLAKARNPGVVQLLALLVLEFRLSILGIQEVADKDPLELVCAELNGAQLPAVSRWYSSHGVQPPGAGVAAAPAAPGADSADTQVRWRVCVSDVPADCLAFLYFGTCSAPSPGADRSAQRQPPSGTSGNERSAQQQEVAAPAPLARLIAPVELRASTLLEPPGAASDRVFSRAPFVADFRVCDGLFTLVNVHLKCAGPVSALDEQRTSARREQLELEQLVQALESAQPGAPGDRRVLLLGDFHRDPAETEFDMLRATGYRNLLQPGAFTNVHFPQKRAQEQSVDAASRGGHQYDQIWASRALAERHVALEGPARCALVVRGAHFLRHPLIPDASTWSFNGLLSDRCPVLLELCARSNEPPPVAAVAPLAMALHQQATTNSTSSMLAAAEEYRTQSSPPIANGHQHSSPPSMANGFLEEREAETISSSASHSPDSYESVGSHSSRFHTPDASTVINLIN